MFDGEQLEVLPPKEEEEEYENDQPIEEVVYDRPPPPRNFCRAGTNLHLIPVEGAKYSAIITGSQCVKADKKKSFTSYKIRVASNKNQVWKTFRRYSEFAQLKNNLKSEFPGHPVPKSFPPKKILKNMTPDLIDKRHQMIQSWLNKVLADNIFGHSELVMHFLEEIKLDPDDDVVDENGNLSIKVDLGRMGYLWILSNGVFKKRWFALRNNVLYKYHTHTDKHPYSQYNWHNISVCEVAPQQDLGLGPLFCFRVSAKSGPLIFATPVEEECDAWIDAIASIETCSVEL